VATEPKVRFRRETEPSGDVRRTASDQIAGMPQPPIMPSRWGKDTQKRRQAGGRVNSALFARPVLRRGGSLTMCFRNSARVQICWSLRALFHDGMPVRRIPCFTFQNVRLTPRPLPCRGRSRSALHTNKSACLIFPDKYQ
jgi:hypothetical protein